MKNPILWTQTKNVFLVLFALPLPKACKRQHRNKESHSSIEMDFLVQRINLHFD